MVEIISHDRKAWDACLAKAAADVQQRASDLLGRLQAIGRCLDMADAAHRPADKVAHLLTAKIGLGELEVAAELDSIFSLDGLDIARANLARREAIYRALGYFADAGLQ